MKKIKILSLVISIIIVMAFMVGQFIFNPPFSDIVYWSILAFLVMLNWNLNLTGKFSLSAAFIIFLLSALVVSIGFLDIGERFMRLSLMFWITGLIQVISEKGE